MADSSRGRNFVQWPRGISMLKEAGRITGRHVDVLDTVSANADFRTRTLHTSLDTLARQMRWRGKKVREQLRQILHDLDELDLIEVDVQERSPWWTIRVPWLRSGSYDPMPHLAARPAPGPAHASAPAPAPSSAPAAALPSAPSDGDGAVAASPAAMRNLRAAAAAQEVEVEVEEEVADYGGHAHGARARSNPSSLFRAPVLPRAVDERTDP